VLVVEDDEQVSSILQQVLVDECYKVEVHASLFQARGAVKKALPDIVILDRQLPDGDGIDFCKELRCDPLTRNVPIMFLTAKKGTPDRVQGMEEGADDYLTKPFSTAELLLHVKAILRRTMNVPEQPALLEVGPLRIEPEARRVLLCQREILLRPKEYNLLLTLLECRSRVLSRPFLLQRAWGFDKDLQLSTNVVDVTIGSLRKKLGAYGACIVSVHSYGFRFDSEQFPVPPAPPSSHLLPPSVAGIKKQRPH
jgi:two-component system phosphate regulon response regulator PhoB